MSIVRYYVKAVDDSGAFSYSDTYSYVVLPVPQVVINEIMYNPSDEQGADAYFEWVEIYNASLDTINLKGWEFTDGEGSYVIPEIKLPPGHYLVLARNADSILNDTNYVDDLNNGNDTVIQWESSLLRLADIDEVVLHDSLGRTIDSVHYSYLPPWPTEPAGGGPSLELSSPFLDNNDGNNWHSSYEKYGTPGEPNSHYINLPPVIESVWRKPDTPFASDTVYIYAIIKDDLDSVITNDSLRYRINSGEWQSVYHDSVKDSLHFYHILPVSDGDTVWYYVWAKDESGAVSVSSLQYYITPGPVPFVVINEIMYNPSSEQGYDSYYEWIELWNYSKDTVDLTGWIITDKETQYKFDTLLLLPYHFVVVARNPDSIINCSEYFDNIFDGDDTVIGPSGLALTDSDEVYLYDRWGRAVDSVIYSYHGAWPTEPAGDGPSLELISPLFDNANIHTVLLCFLLLIVILNFIPCSVHRFFRHFRSSLSVLTILNSKHPYLVFCTHDPSLSANPAVYAANSSMSFSAYFGFGSFFNFIINSLYSLAILILSLQK